MNVRIERGMPAAEYHAVRAASSTRLKEILRSPAHLRWLDENGKTADALALGEALHARVLEGHMFDERFVVAPDIDRRTRDGRAAWEMFVNASVGRQVLTHDEAIAISGMHSALMSHDSAADLIEQARDRELSLFWENECGFPSKARIDGYCAECRCLIDIKTTLNASKEEFSRSIARFGYALQAAWYIDAMRRAGFDVETMIFIAVEKTGPYGVACYTLGDDSIAIGRSQYTNAMALLAACEALNVWPSYSKSIERIDLPSWARSSGDGESL
jgi:hypothetical protein